MTRKLRVLYYNTFLTMEMGEGMVSRAFLAAAGQLPDWELITVSSGGPALNSENGTAARGRNTRRSGGIKGLVPQPVRKAVRSFLSPMSPYPVGPYLHKRRMITRLKDTLTQHQPFDVLLLHLSQGDLGTLAELCGRTTTPIVLRAPGPFAYQADQLFQRFISPQDRQHERFLYSRADAICVISEHMKRLMARETGVQAEKLFAVPNGIHFERFDPAQANGEQIRQALGLRGRKIVGYIGGFWPGNDLTTLLHAWHGVETAAPDATLLLVGYGPERAAAQALSQELNLQHCVWVDRVPHSDIPHYIAALDVGVGPYVAAALEFVSPLKVMEYMTVGIPVVATDGGQIAELVSHGTTGRLYPAGAAEPLQAELLTLLRDPDAAAVLGCNARQHMLNWFSWDDIAYQMMSICQQVAL